MPGPVRRRKSAHGLRSITPPPSSDADSSEPEEKKGDNVILRFIIFAFIAGPASAFGFGIYGRMDIESALGAAFMVFKR